MSFIPLFPQFRIENEQQGSRKMSRSLRILPILLICVVVGCVSPFQRQVEQSLLLQENQQLENALYVTHQQLVDLKQENDALKDELAGQTSVSPSETPRTSRRTKFAPREALDDAPEFFPPQILMPEGVPGSTTPPDSLKTSETKQSFPVWLPTR